MKAENEDPGLEIDFKDNSLAQSLFGEHNSNLRLIESVFPVKISAAGARVIIEGHDEVVRIVGRLLMALNDLQKEGCQITPFDVERAAKTLEEHPKAPLREIFFETVYVSHRKRVIAPKSVNQKRYVDAIKKHDIVFGIGPAGTGKTYLAIAAAVAALQRKEVERIVLTRPAVEAGEKLGFLPGDLIEKVNPYLRPLYDALHDMLDINRVKEMLDNDVIEVAPLAFMRGRTLSNSFVILDEAQNTTSEQMKMFLTRLGIGSKAVITGDITQIDLPFEKVSGLVEAGKILGEIKGISFVRFTEKDVIRHNLVKDIIDAYRKIKKG